MIVLYYHKFNSFVAIDIILTEFYLQMKLQKLFWVLKNILFLMKHSEKMFQPIKLDYQDWKPNKDLVDSTQQTNY